MLSLLSAFPFPYRILVIALLIAAVFGYGWIKGAQHGEAKLSAFVAEVKLEAAKSQAFADARIASDKRLAEHINTRTARDVARLRADADRLRNARARTFDLPAAPAVAGSPACPEGLACFDRGELLGAIRRLDEGVHGIAAEGDEVALKLTLAREWAGSR